MIGETTPPIHRHQTRDAQSLCPIRRDLSTPRERQQGVRPLLDTLPCGGRDCPAGASLAGWVGKYLMFRFPDIWLLVLGYAASIPSQPP
jgi:hypothetical protein